MTPQTGDYRHTSGEFEYYNFDNNVVYFTSPPAEITSMTIMLGALCADGTTPARVTVTYYYGTQVIVAYDVHVYQANKEYEVSAPPDPDDCHCVTAIKIEICCELDPCDADICVKILGCCCHKSKFC